MSIATTTTTTIATILAAMAVVALAETVIPLRARGRWSRAHLGPNLALTFITFATNTILNSALVLALIGLHDAGFGLLALAPFGTVAELAIVVLGLDLAFYVGHVAMHKVPLFWRYHAVHHSDLEVDVTTTIRQHPGEGVIRYVFMAGFAFALGATPGAFAIYRVWSVLSGLLEHANIRLPPRVDAALSLVFTWPGMHKIHHSRDPRYTDTNYGTIVSWWDRLFGTFTPTRYGVNVVYGLGDGFDDDRVQTTVGLLELPFRTPRQPALAVRTHR